MSHGEILILQQLLADLIEKGYVEPTDPMSQWSAPVMILRKSGTRAGGSDDGTSTDWSPISDGSTL